MLVCRCKIKPVDKESRTKLNEEKREKKLTWGPNDDTRHLGPRLILVPPSRPRGAFRAPAIHGRGRVITRCGGAWACRFKGR
jgi:hypothetical protein